MSKVVQSGAVCTFDVTFDSPSLSVAMSVYDDSGGSPSLVQGPTAMANVVGNTYRGKFTPTAGKSYLIYKAVYTAGDFLTLDTNYYAGSEAIQAVNLAGASLKKNVAVTGFTFQMFDDEGSPKTGLTVTATRSIDGASFAACANAVAELGLGWYKIDFATTDLNGVVIGFNFAATGAVPTAFTIITEAA